MTMPNKHLSPPGAPDGGALPPSAAEAGHPEAGRRRLLKGSLGLLAGGGLLGLGGCGGADDDEVANARVINATTDFTSGKVLIEGVTVAALLSNGGTATRYYQIAPGSRTLALHSNTDSGDVISSTLNLRAGEVSTVICYGLGASVPGQAMHILEDEAAPSASQVKLRLLHLAPNMAALGAVDLYTSSAGSLAGVDPVATVSGYGVLPDSFATVARGAYRIRVARRSNPAEVLFDSGELISFAGGSVVTLALSPRTKDTFPDLAALPERNGSAGVLVNALSAVA